MKLSELAAVYPGGYKDEFDVKSDNNFMARMDLEKRKYDFDLNGHFRNIKPYRFVFDHILSLWLRAPSETVLALGSKKKLDHFLPVGATRLCRCSQCGEVLQWETNGEVLRVVNSCPYPNGVPIEVELNVPSGKMVVANDLRQIFPIMGHFNINEAIGCAKTTYEHANFSGMIHCFVGNTCPSMYKKSEKDFVIATGSVKGHRKVANICTDLWWYSIADYDEYIRRSGEEPVDSVVVCEPGVYRFVHEYVGDKRGIFTNIKHLRKPDKLTDFKSRWEGLNFTAGQILLDSILEYPSLYANGADPVDWLQRAADHCFCVNGSGVEAHPNGFLYYRPLAWGSLDISIPQFKKRYHWYDLSDWSFLAAGAGMGGSMYPNINLNKTFAELAFNICQCVIRYGLEENNRNQKEGVKLAKKWIKALAKRYTPPNYCKELL